MRLPLFLAIFFALSLRVLVPAGWMPAQGGGAFAIAPCPAFDDASMVMDGQQTAAHHHHDGLHKEHNGSDCSFSPYHSGFAGADQARFVPATLATDTILRVLVGTPIAPTGPPALPPPSTGPPALT